MACGSEDRRRQGDAGAGPGAFVNGLGVPQDYVEAHKWLNLAAAWGNAEAADERESLAAKMTPRQVAAAQERARSWKPGGGADVPKAADSTLTTASFPLQGRPRCRISPT